MNSFFAKTIAIASVVLSLASLSLTAFQWLSVIPDTNTLKPVYYTLVSGLMATIATILGNGLMRVVADDRNEFSKRRYDALIQLAESLQAYSRKPSEKSLRNVQSVFDKSVAVVPRSVCISILEGLKVEALDAGASINEIRRVIGIDKIKTF